MLKLPRACELRYRVNSVHQPLRCLAEFSCKAGQFDRESRVESRESECSTACSVVATPAVDVSSVALLRRGAPVLACSCSGGVHTMPPRDRSDRDQSGRVRSNEQKEKDRAQKQAKYVQDRAKKLLREKQEAKVAEAIRRGAKCSPASPLGEKELELSGRGRKRLPSGTCSLHLASLSCAL